ncbi:hypothetical protein Tco_0044476 [Tanacetum coccineum]
MWCLYDPTPSDWIHLHLGGSHYRFLGQFFPLGRTAKLRNDILMFQQHQEDLALYDNESLNDPRDVVKLVKAISLPQDVPNASDRRLIELENQVQYLMEAQLAPKSFVQVNKITSSCEICSGPHDTQYFMENPEQAFVDYNGAPLKNGIIKCPSKLLSPKHQSQPSLRDEGRNSLYPKRVNFVNIITIIRKEDELKEAKCLKLDSDDRHLDRNNENLVDKELKNSEIVIDEEESSDLGINDDRGEVDKENEWVEYEEPLDLVDTNEE